MSNLPELEPRDAHNLVLETHVHPREHTNPKPFDGRYNLVVIGAGTAGLVTAAGAAGLGAKVALVERRLMGGDCLNVGCVPSKGIIAAARRAAAVHGAGEFGMRVPEGATVDFGAAMERMRGLRAGIAKHDSVKRFQSLGIDVFLGEAGFLDRETVEVGGARLRFKKAVIATGARAAAPSIEGLDGVDYLTNETLFSLTERPERFGIVGAGPIGCEMAQAFARLGSKVFLIANEKGILPREDRDAAAIVRSAMERDGVRIVEGGRELAVSRDGDRTRLRAGDFDERVDRLLIAVGRTPNVEGLRLDNAGVEFDRKGVKVDDRLRTSNPHIFAAGDICSPFQFTHAADFMARTVLRNALFLGRAKASALIIPWSTYTAPEIARVGLDEHEAAEKGIAIDTYTQPMSGVDRAILDGETEGFVRIHTMKGKDRIVGATIVSAHAGDLIGAVSLAMTNGIGLGGIANAIHPYPTQAEALRKVGDLYRRSRLTPFVAKLMGKWLASSRR
jgi:pyruvate/2-oxoglutarate dehydrogenase complex dihydrolipoamide dehydrogenase (E3) component